MTIPGFTDQELADLARKKGASEESVRKWLDSTKRVETPSPFEMFDAGAVFVTEAAPTPAPKPDRGRTGPKRASTPRRSEASVQREIIYALTNAGWRTWRIGQYNARRTQDAGVPDVYAMRPWAIGYAMPLQCWVEVKRSHGGRQSVAQREFQRQCEAAGVRYILATSVDDIRELL